MKTAVAFYYKNIHQYNPRWVIQCIESIRNQSYKDFEVFVLNYGDEPNESFNFNVGKRYHFMHKPLPNYADAMNEIYAWIFESCDVVVNTNIDDYYSTKRIEYLLKDLANGADIASSNVHIVNQQGKISYSPVYSNMNILQQLKKGFNPVSNPGHAMKKRVFEQLQFDSSLVPAEDMDFWKRAIEAGFKIVINTRYLHYYRMHPNQATHISQLQNDLKQQSGKLSLWDKMKNYLD